jgi:hypothetical protein
MQTSNAPISHSRTDLPILMTTTKQRAAAKKNIKRAATAAKRKRTVAHLPKSVRTALGKEGAKAARKKRAA